MRDKISRPEGIEGESLDAYIEQECPKGINRHKEMCQLAVRLPFVNENGEQLKFTKQLELAHALQEQPLYH